MRSSSINKISVRAMEIALPFKPNLKDFDNGKDFADIYYDNVKFVQVVYYDRHDGEDGSVNVRFNMDIDKKDEFLEAIKTYELKLKEAQTQAIKESGISEYDERTYRYYERVGSDIGYCHVYAFTKHKEDDEKRYAKAKAREDREPNCSACGDGGCIHCEPSRFIEGYNY